MNNSIKPLLFLITLIISSLSYAQYSEEFTTLIAQFPEEQMVQLKDYNTVTITIEDEEIAIKQHFEEERFYLDETAKYASKSALSYSSFFALEDIEAYSYAFENGKYKAYKVEDFVSKDEIENSFYDDAKSLNFIYPNLSKGGKTKISYTEIVKNPRFLSPVYFADFYPIQDKKITFIVDNEITLKFKEFNFANVKASFNKKVGRSKTTYSWELKNVAKIEYEENIPTIKNVLPHIVPIISSYKVADKKIKVLDGVNDLYSWYYSLVKDINQEPCDPELEILVKELTKDAKTNLEKVKNIYYWTQQNIKYIAFEYALGGFIPREANDVYNKKYGDCKDNSSILLEMLKIAGLEGNLTWIGTRSIPYDYNEVPTPIVDNHMILTYKDGNTYFFLDATGRYLSMDLPSSFIQGKEALISKGPNDFEIVRVPIVSGDKNQFTDNSELYIDNETLKGKSTTTIGGFYKIDLFNDLEQKNSDQKITEYYNTKFRKGSNKFLTNNITEDNKFSYDNDFVVNYNFEIKDYINSYDDELYVNLNLNQDIVYYKTEEDRQHDIEVKYKSDYLFKNSLSLPEGYVIDYLPENFTEENEFFKASINYIATDNKIVYTHQLLMNYLTLNAKEQKIVNTAIKNVQKQFKEVIVLKKKN